VEMASRNTGSMSGSKSSSKGDARDCKKIEEGEQASQPLGAVSSTINQLKKQVQVNRVAFVKERIESNEKKLAAYTAYLQIQTDSRKTTNLTELGGTKDMLTLRIENALCKLSGLDPTSGDKETVNCQEESCSSLSTINFGSSSGGKSIVRPIKLPFVEMIPPYTTWIFLDRNQRMTEDQSVVGRRRIYYDQCGNEALICSDSEEEVAEEEDEKHEFTEGDDCVLRMTIQEHGQCQAVLNTLSQHIKAKPSEIEARFVYLLAQDKEKQESLENVATAAESADFGDIFLGKDLDAALDSFDNLFCRRCLVFDCRLHGCSQGLVLPSDKQPEWSNLEEDNKTPCGIHCYLLALKDKESTDVANPSNLEACEEKPVDCATKYEPMKFSPKEGSGADSYCIGVQRPRTLFIEGTCSSEKVTADSSHGESDAGIEGSFFQHTESPRRGKRRLKRGGVSRKNYKRTAKEVLVSMRKRQKMIVASDTDSVASGGTTPSDINLSSSARHSDTSKLKVSQKKSLRTTSATKRSRKQDSSDKDVDINDMKQENEIGDETKSVNDMQLISTEKQEWGACNKDAKVDISIDIRDDNGWSAIEKGLYLKGIEIFGKNSCLIARNLLSRLRTCSEIAEYMSHNVSAIQYGVGDVSTLHSDGSRKTDCGETLDTEVRTRARFWRRKGRVRRLKYTWKSAGHPSIRKRIADGKGQPCRQYTPCGCQLTCGKQCPCLRNGTCCEKYCGCSKSCKNRFRGCHCAKSQCRSRQCPCFAAGRECDPDVCRNCWVGCGDGTLGVPLQRGDNECKNMKLLLRQQQRVLLGKSDVAGWGAFLKNPVNKHEYLGEYTGELISHKEADKRGKIYDREDSSFLFNLNDQFVLDAYRKGDKLKFANHSPNPNCYAKVIMVAGDHRVGIFAKERIASGEELFYDYRYEPDRAPVWARKPEGSNSRREEASAPHGRAKKIA